jgi:hypothetical protein
MYTPARDTPQTLPERCSLASEQATTDTTCRGCSPLSRPTPTPTPARRSRRHPRVVRLRLFRRYSTASMPTLAFAASARDDRPRFVRRRSPRARESRTHNQLRARGPSVLVPSAHTPRSYPFSRPGTCEPPPLAHRQAAVGCGICVGADITTGGRGLVKRRETAGEPARRGDLPAASRSLVVEPAPSLSPSAVTFALRPSRIPPTPRPGPRFCARAALTLRSPPSGRSPAASVQA